jgi:hypothetical protein
VHLCWLPCASSSFLRKLCNPAGSGRTPNWCDPSESGQSIGCRCHPPDERNEGRVLHTRANARCLSRTSNYYNQKRDKKSPRSSHYSRLPSTSTSTHLVSNSNLQLGHPSPHRSLQVSIGSCCASISIHSRHTRHAPCRLGRRW